MSCPYQPAVALTFGHEGLKLYINRQLVAQASVPEKCENAVGPVDFRKVIFIGIDETGLYGERNFRGDIDEVRIMGRPLNPSEFIH